MVLKCYTSTMSRKFAVFDIDGTLIRWQLYHALTDELAKRGYMQSLAHEAIKQARMDWKRRTYESAFRNYEKAVVAAYEEILKSLTTEQLGKAVESVIDEYKDQTYAYTRQLINDLKAKDYILFAISGSQTELVAHIAAHYGFDDYSGTDYLQKGGLFTGEKVFHARNKRKVLDKLIAKHDVNNKDSIAVGDSMSDVPMLEAVEQPIAFNPEIQLFEHAKTQSWKIVVERKNVVYELGLKGDDYVLKT